VWAAQVFEEHGIQAHGFRCPYLSCTDEILDALPKGLFDYTSNKAIGWEGFASTHNSNPGLIFDTLYRFYQPRSSRETLRVPSTHFNMVEIPVCVPDDLQLHDGLHLGPEGIAQVWNQTLHQTYRRGELFTLAFHPELVSCHEQSFAVVLRAARQLQPHVWITRLRDISDWWREKAGFKVGISHTSTGLRISFSCSPRATILTRGLGSCGSACMWDGVYYRLPSRILDVPADSRPFVGLASDVPGHVVSFLQEQGYILDTRETATHCGTYLNGDMLARLTSEVELINYIEASTSPLVRYWRWPNTAKSAMCITGDVDALTLLDYASRPFVR
jgi:hypothetical protein